MGAGHTGLGTAFGILLACLLVGMPVHRIVTLWFDQELSFGEAAVALFLLLVFLMGIISTWGRPASAALWFLLLALSLTITIGGRALDRRKRDRFFEDDVAQARRALAAQPDNAAAHMRLGNLFAGKGDWEAAAQHYEEVARIVPRDGEARLALAHAIEKRRLAATRHIVCWSCGRENAKTAGRCAGCGALISDRNQLVAWLSSREVSGAILALGGILVPLTVAVTLVPGLPGAVTVLVYGALFLVALCYAYPRWVRAKG